VSLVAKVKGRAGDVYQQAKTRYADSDAMQKAGKQAGEALTQASEAGKQLTGRLKDLAAKATAAVKDAQAKGASHR
jgi:hypothetical protein